MIFVSTVYSTVLVRLVNSANVIHEEMSFVVFKTLHLLVQVMHLYICI